MSKKTRDVRSLKSKLNDNKTFRKKISRRLLSSFNKTSERILSLRHHEIKEKNKDHAFSVFLKSFLVLAFVLVSVKVWGGQGHPPKARGELRQLKNIAKNDNRNITEENLQDLRTTFTKKLNDLDKHMEDYKSRIEGFISYCENNYSDVRNAVERQRIALADQKQEKGIHVVAKDLIGIAQVATNAIVLASNKCSTEYNANASASPYGVSFANKCQPTEEEAAKSEEAAAKAEAEAITSVCLDYYAHFRARAAREAKTGIKLYGDATRTRNRVLAGAAIGGAAIGGAIIYKNKQSSKKKKKKAKQAEEDYQEGVIMVNGERTECFIPSNVGNADCRETYFRLCQSNKKNSAGCSAFNNNFCAGAGHNSNYCLYSQAKKYCNEPAPYREEFSPSCVWASGRPKSCVSNPEDISCLASHSRALMNEQCEKFPNDPLCGAYKGGRVVLQGGGAAGQPEGTGSSMSLSSVIGGGTGPGGQGGLPNIGGSNSDLMSSNSNVLNNLCQQGLLAGC